jgi:hypothetical protein
MLTLVLSAPALRRLHPPNQRSENLERLTIARAQACQRAADFTVNNL